ncbi:histidine phosphatase family protein [Larsenimonas rhizosphaerae]|uniref:Histidine phosphatase family protein n=1 Tax=Larsenimonas rhizosphaerae TaxID=2944682 RepID=A0AA41ZLI4_9GAMM|nr:histidine phosphatase family protein [Larsenimonas rhizosphaerae]MCX2523005.1 histidine phosphatase family protein [Larsenimonas rhizosphaerae]
MSLLPRPFVFVRHGETFYNRARIIAGRFDVPLTPDGEQQAINARDWLDEDWSYIAVSDMFRARKTAMLAVPNGRFHYFHGLRERNWGTLEGQAYRHPMPYVDTPEGGESWDGFRHRVLDVINTVLDQYERPLFVAHSGVFRVIRDAAIGTHEGPRVNNVSPVECVPPGRGQTRWELRPLAENAFADMTE